jgi:ubiquinone/menaquinone biosynthesis C-methylase UbiE
MHSFTRHQHNKSRKAEAKQTQGRVINLGWRYDLMLWFFDTFILRGKLRELRQKTLNFARLQAGEQVLDVGCGTGTLALEVVARVGPSGRVCGIDPGSQQILRARLKAARRNSPVDFQLGVIEQLPFPDAMFDVVFSTLMMHHLPADLKRKGLLQIARVLKPGGRLVIADFKSLEKAQTQPRGFGAGSSDFQSLLALIEQAGFSRLETEEMQFPHFPVLPGEHLGFVRAYKN